MIRITVEMVPRGDESRKRKLAMMEIVNENTGTMEVGNYTGTLHAEYTNPAGRKGRIEGFRRQRQSVWSLIGAFLKLWGHTKHSLKTQTADSELLPESAAVNTDGTARQ